jgi:hypothetical protein
MQPSAQAVLLGLRAGLLNSSHPLRAATTMLFVGCLASLLAKISL